MCGKYDVLYDGDCIGAAQINAEGLYYKIKVCCYIYKPTMLRIRLVTSVKTIDLGILVPNGDHFTLQKSISRKTVSGEFINLTAYATEEKIKFDTCCAENYLHLLENAKLIIDNGLKYIIIQ